MAPDKRTLTPPLSFEVDEATFDRLKKLASRAGQVSLSALVEYALEQYDYSSLSPRDNTRKQVSVRLPEELRDRLEKNSEKENVSMAHLIRLALESLTETSLSGKSLTQLKEDMAAKKVVKKKVAKKAAKKVAAKKVAKKVAKKATAKKAAKKAPAKKAAKKATAKKAAAKKTAGPRVAKKAAKKVAAKKAAKKGARKAARKAAAGAS